ncbi:MAG: hypothetical protein Q9165_002836 [Trypethelium subeluteriae]
MALNYTEEDIKFVALGARAMRGDGPNNSKKEEPKVGPVFSAAAQVAARNLPHGYGNFDPQQYGLIGWHRTLDSAMPVPDGLDKELPEELRLDPMPICLNTDIPWSAFICGSPGSGKENTFARILESCLVEDTTVGKLPNLMAGLVFYYDSYPSVCEAAKLCSGATKVKVLVSPDMIYKMTHLYKDIPGSENLTVVPVKLLPRHLSPERMTNLMCIGGDATTPFLALTMSLELQKIRAIADKQGKGSFDYLQFRSDARDQYRAGSTKKAGLEQRFQRLDKFLENAEADVFGHEPGTLTIVHLTSEWINAAEACQIFDTCLEIFMEKRVSESGHPLNHVVALAEAQKCLNESMYPLPFTNNLLKIIRGRRNDGTRVIIATEEPNLSSEFLASCSLAFIHRFSSPDWFAKLQKGIGALSSDHVEDFQDESDPDGKTKDLFGEVIGGEIMTLGVREALLCGPTALIGVKNGTPQELAKNFLRLHIRDKVSEEEGKNN